MKQILYPLNYTLFKTLSLFLISIVLLVACSETQEIIYDPASVTLTILNDSAKAQSAAEVRIYDDIDAYMNSKNNGVYEGFSAKASTDASGKVSFNKLNTAKDYYFLVEYRDRARYVDLNNYDQTFKFTKGLSQGSNTFAQIQLKQAKSVIGFYIPEGMADNLPVKLYLDDDTVGIDITNIASGAVTQPNQAGVLNFKLSAGLTKWHAKSPKGCYWGGEINVGTTESFSPISLNACYAGSVNFYVDAQNKDNLPIKITLDNADVLGSISNYTDTAPACFAYNAVSAARDTGTYTYTAESLKNSCVWQGKVKITQGGCQTILLPKCN
jgi:hypothetical protein